MSYAIFDDAGNCMGMSAVERDGYEEVEFDLGVSIKKVDGTVRMMTDDELPPQTLLASLLQPLLITATPEISY